MKIDPPLMNDDATVKLIQSLRKLADDLEVFTEHGPDALLMETTISGWALAKRAVPALIGIMDGHPSIKDGNPGITSELVFWDVSQGVARSQNRWYRLGTPMSAPEGRRQ